jgi:hypothetical protein
MTGTMQRGVTQRPAAALRYALASSAIFALLAGAAAQTPPPAQPKAPAAQPPPQVAMPDADKIVLLLRGTLLTLNDAVQTGNFTVLRDLSAPGFRDANSAARLGAIFGNLAQRGIDLSAVAILAPQLGEAPSIDPQTSMLRIKGFFPGQPVRIDFEVIYQPVGGRWRLFGLSVQPTSTASQTAQPAPPAANPAPGPPAAKKAADPPPKK